MKYLSIHHTSSPGDNPQFDAVNKYHKGKWDMMSRIGYYVGYNYMIEKSGRLRQARQIGEETMAQKGHNFDTISVCLAGDFNVEHPTEAQKATLTAFILDMKDKYPDIKVMGHRDLQENRTCPGKNFNMGEFINIKKKETMNYLSGKKSYIVGILMIALGILNGEHQLILEGLGLISLRLGISKIEK